MSQLSILSVASTPSVPTTFATDSGDAVPVANTINIDGANGITTSGAGNTVTITGPNQDYVTDSGTATSVGNSVNIVGGTGVMTSAVGDTITIDVESAVSLSFPANTGTAIPSSNLVNVLGISGITTTGAGNTLTINNLRDITKYLVSATGDSEFSTISAAITQAVADGATNTNRATIYVKPGTYTEVVTLAPGIDIIGGGGRDSAQDTLTADASSGKTVLVQLVGGLIGPASGSATVSYMAIAPGTDIHTVNAATGTTHIYSCYLANNRTGFHIISATGGSVFCFKSYFVITFPGDGTVSMNNVSSKVSLHECCGAAGSNGPMYISNGTLNVFGGIYQGGIALSGGVANLYYPRLNAQGTGGGAVHVTGGSLRVRGATVSGGAGGVTGTAGTVRFSGGFSEDTEPVLSPSYSGTLEPYSFGAGNIRWVGGWSVRPTIVSSFPYTMLLTDSYLSVGGTGARTVNLVSTGRVTGQTVVIKDAAANSSSSGNITISGNGVNIIGSSSASTYILSTDGASVSLTYNGTAWEVW